MKKLILLFSSLFLLVACPKEEEVIDAMELIAVRKELAEILIKNGDFSTRTLLDVQDYFFNIEEKIFLLEEDPKAAENIRRYVKKVGIDQFCKDFVLPLRAWRILQTHCKKGSVYRCSADIDRYEINFKRLQSALGDDYSSQMRKSPNCN